MSGDNDCKSHISWCWKQKRGFKIEEPNDNLCKGYIKKAKSALNMLDSAIEKNEIYWIVTTSYYSRYFVLYALLQKCGIKSEIHDCTISLMRFLLVEESIIEEKFYVELLSTKGLRVDTQYYVTEEINIDRLKQDSVTAKSFILRMEEIIEKIDETQIQKIRKKLINART